MAHDAHDIEEFSIEDLPKRTSVFSCCRRQKYRSVLSSGDIEDIPNYQIDTPEIHASWISRIFFFWFNALIAVGKEKPLQSEDLYRLEPKHDPNVSFDTLNRNWLNSGERGHRSLVKALVRSFWKEFFISAFPRLFKLISSFLNPMIVGLLISFIEDPNGKTIGIGILYVFILIVSTSIGSIGLNQNWYHTTSMVSHIRSAILMTTYSKLLKLSSPAKQNYSSGKIINLMSNDTSKIQETGLNIHFLWIAPASLIICFALVVNVMGPKAALGGQLVLLVLTPLSYIIGRKLHKTRNEQVKITDERIKKSTELFQVIKTLKYYALEKVFAIANQEARDKEVQFIRKYLIWKGLQKCINFTLVPLMSMATFITYILVGGSLTPTVAFSTISLYNVLKWPFSIFNQVVTGLIEAKVAINRLEDFLELEEIEEYKKERNVNLESSRDEGINKNGETSIYEEEITSSKEEDSLLGHKDGNKSNIESYRLNEKLDSEHAFSDIKSKNSYINSCLSNPPSPHSYCSPSIYIEDASFSWSGDKDAITLDNVNFFCNKPELICVVGSVGAGKSSFINVIINEIPKIHGTAITRGSIGYSTQAPFLIHGTVRENILFEKPFDERLYNKVIELCKLQQDFDMLIAGDMTLIGERGINLSGGQKARISLARAIYSNADILVLDDPLAAVDSHVSKYLFEKCIRDYLKNKITVLITHQLQYISQADRIVYMENGRIVVQGTFQELMESGFDIAEVLSKMSTESQSEDSKVQALEPSSNVETTLESDKKSDQPSNLIKDEERQFGGVSFSIYKFFFKEAIFLWILYLFLVLGHRAIDLWLQFYLAEWSQTQIPKQHASSSTMGLIESRAIEKMYVNFILIYTFVTIAVSLILLIREVVLSIVCTKTGNELYKKMTSKLLKGTMAFFDTTPKGRIIARISSDIDAIDTQISQYFSLGSENFFQVLAALITIVISVKWWALLFVPLPFVYAWRYRTFIVIYRELARIFSITKAPIFSQINESINGMQTIRAFKLSHPFEQKIRNSIDENQKPYLYMFTASRWLSIRNDFNATVVISIVGFTAIVSRHSISPGFVGIGLTYALLATELMSGLVRCLGDIESQMNAIERIKQYTVIDTERNDIIKGHRPSSVWPSMGEIQFKDVDLRYRPGLPLVLKNVSFTIKPMEKVGIVGRTGSGKSTLLSALFSFTSLEKGNIYIDNVDIHTIGVYDLRKKLSIIPQDPVIFDGTIRRNLDPVGKHTDEELWEILHRVHLHKYVSSLSDKLDTILFEEGSNFSLGQRQLLCVGRALLRNCKILVLDEASSSIDVETDSLLQETIRREFRNCTILSIAHRIQTIINYDRILVLSEGRVVEFDKPEELIKKGGVFSSMCKDAKIKI